MSTKRWHDYRDLEKRFGPMTLGRYINAWREADEISLTEYAKKLKMSRANLCDIEKGRKLVSPERAAKIARLMEHPEDFFIQLCLQDMLRAQKLPYTVEIKKTA